MIIEIIFFLVILAVLVAGFVVLGRYLRPDKERDAEQSLLLLQNQINELSHTLNANLNESSRAIRDQFGESTKIIREITRELVRVSEGQKQVMNVTDQLKNLQDILKNPKQRGVLGEYYLETVLKNVLPPGNYQLQYKFQDGVIVDAIIITKEGIIPVDSKFSLENYNRFLEAPTPAERERYENAFAADLKTRVDETAKYIKPEEGTLSFVFMFIPSEAVYYDLLVNKVGATKSNTVNLIEYAAGQKKVIVVSPTTFFAYLQTVLQGLRALQIEESAKEIRRNVELLGRHLTAYAEHMYKLGNNLDASVNAYNKAYKEFGKVDKDVLKITGDTTVGLAETTALDGPAAHKAET